MGNEDYTSSYRYPIIQQTIKNPIIISTTKFDYFKDEYIEGNITLQNQFPIVLSDINLNLYLLEAWTYMESSNQSVGEINTQPLLNVKVGINKILNIETELINLSAGIFNFPFKFRLPDYLQPCFEYPITNSRGYLRYSLEAKFISPYTQGSSSIYLIIKSRPKVLNSPLSFTSVMNIHKWGLFDQGTTVLKVSYLTNNFRINDKLNLKVEINNLRGKLKAISCEINLVRKVGFRKKNEDKNKYEMENIIYNKNFPISVEPANQKSYDFSIDISDKDKTNFNYTNLSNPYPNIVDIGYVMPTVDGSIIKCDYNIKATLYFESYVTSGYLPKVTLPIIITHQLLDDYNLERQEDEDLKRAIEASKLDNKNVNISCIDNNRLGNMIEKPNGYDMEKMQPVSKSQLIEEDNDLPSKIEIEKNRQNSENNNININQINFENDVNNNNYNKNSINDNSGNCPAPVFIYQKIENNENLNNPYMNNNNINQENNNNQINKDINNNYPNYNNINNENLKNNNINNNINNQYLNNNQNINNKNPNYNDNQLNKNFSNDNNINNVQEKKDEDNQNQEENDFSVFNNNIEDSMNNEKQSNNKEIKNYYNINEV